MPLISFVIVNIIELEMESLFGVAVLADKIHAVAVVVHGVHDSI